MRGYGEDSRCTKRVNLVEASKTCNCSEQGGFAGAGGSHDDGERGRQRVAVGALDEAVGEAVCGCAAGGDGEVLPDEGGPGHLALPACGGGGGGGGGGGEGGRRGRVGAAVDGCGGGGCRGEVDGVVEVDVVPVGRVLEGDGAAERSAGLGQVVAARGAAGGGGRGAVLLLHCGLASRAGGFPTRRDRGRSRSLLGLGWRREEKRRHCHSLLLLLLLVSSLLLCFVCSALCFCFPPAFDSFFFSSSLKQIKTLLLLT